MTKMGLEISYKELDSLPPESLAKYIFTSSVKELETLAIEAYNTRLHGHHPYYLRLLLKERCKKMNQNFIWTVKNKEKIITLNDEFFQVFKKAYDEIVLIAEEMKKRLPDGGWINSDYALAIVITPVFGSNERKADREIHDVLVHYENEYHGLANLPNMKGVIIYDFELSPDGYLDKSAASSNAQNGDQYFGHIFDGITLNEAFGDLVRDWDFSFKDIVSIENVCATVTVYRYFNQR
jgi:hypothetical protein